MKIEKLYYFLSVAKHRNFTKAAQECHIAQPAISKQMLSLEKELGFQLFERKNRRVELTEAGEQFYQSISCLLKTFFSRNFRLHLEYYESDLRDSRFYYISQNSNDYSFILFFWLNWVLVAVLRIFVVTCCGV